MSAEPGRSVQIAAASAESGLDWRTLLIVGGVTAVMAIIAFGLARVARGVPRFSKPVKIAVCATILPLTLITTGFMVFEDGQNLFDWIVSRPPRAYRNLAIVWAVSLFGAWLGLREKERKLDLSTFE